MGASVDHINNIMYVSSNNIPWEAYVEKIDSKKMNHHLITALLKEL